VRRILNIAFGVTALTAVLVAQAAVVKPTPPDVKARAYILQDFDSGKVLVEVNADESLEPASLTKMMTVYVTLAQLADGKFQIDDPVRISEKAWKMGGSKMFIEVGKEVPVEDLLKGVIIQSGNDASVALAEFVAGDETATLAIALIRDFPVHYPLHAVRTYTWNNIKQYNRNPLLTRDDSVDAARIVVAGFQERGLTAHRDPGVAALRVSIFRDRSPLRGRCSRYQGARLAGRVGRARVGYQR